MNGMAHTNGVESFWSMLKRGYHGVYHHMSPKHLQRYVDAFAWRHTSARWTPSIRCATSWPDWSASGSCTEI